MALTLVLNRLPLAALSGLNGCWYFPDAANGLSLFCWWYPGQLGTIALESLERSFCATSACRGLGVLGSF